MASPPRVPTTEELHIEVAHARPGRQIIIALQVPPGTTVAEAILQSCIAEKFSGLDVVHSEVGIFGQLVERDRPLRDGDRVEIYRPLQADPKERRRKRAAGG